MTPNDELLAVFADRRRRADGLAVWAGGEDRLHALLQMALLPKAEAARRGVEMPEFPWESLADRMVQWHYAHPLGDGQYNDDDLFEALMAATEAVRIAPLEAGVRGGAFQVRKTRDAFRVTYRWDVSLEVADLYLERQARPAEVPGPTEAELKWAAGKSKGQLNAFEPPAEILQAAARRCAVTVGEWRAAVDDAPLGDDFDLGDGLTMGIMAQVLAGLMAVAQLGELAHARVRAQGTTLFHAPRQALVAMLTTAWDGLTPEAADAAIGRLVTGPGRSLRTSLLVPIGPLITVLPLTMFPRAIDPIALRTAAANPSLYGSIGRMQGHRAAVWGSWLAQIPGVKVAQRLKLRGPDGRTLGDLDMLAVDSRSGKGIVLELKWPVDALTLPETEKIDRNVLDGCRQLARDRRLLRDGEATVKMPPGWPAFDDVEWTWAVGTPQQLYTGPLPVPDMHATSLRYVKSLGSLGSLEALASALRDPDVPRLGQHYTVERHTIDVGRHLIHWDAIHVLDSPWRPKAV
jgi:hypothetical protein